MRVSTPLAPARWPVVPAKFLFEQVRRRPCDADGVVTAFRDGEVTLRSKRRLVGFTNAIQELGYQGVRQGDLVIHSMDGFAGAIGVSDSNGKASPVVHCYTSAPGVDSRFYAYLLRRLAQCDFISSLAKGIRERSTAFDADAFRSLLLPAPPPQEQRAIADYLDAETARLDALITKKRRMIELVRERNRSESEALLAGAERRVALRRVADLLPGYSFASSEFGPHASGPRLLRGVNVQVGAIRWDDTVRLDGESPIHERYRLAVGDVVVGMDRPFIVGGTRVARVDSESAGAILVQRVCRVRTPTIDEAILVEHVLRSTAFVAHVEPDLTGVSVPHLSEDQIGSMPVPVFDESALAAVASRLLAISHRSMLTVGRLEQQIALLQEHRQALITAAVSGELELPGVAA